VTAYMEIIRHIAASWTAGSPIFIVYRTKSTFEDDYENKFSRLMFSARPNDSNVGEY